MSEQTEEPQSETPYPLHLKGELIEPLSRWLWLIKWLLLIPHYIILFFLGIAYVLVSIIAFFSILFAGKYPRSLFNFNVGVLRWFWRVMFYSYQALGTDKYPPFTLKAGGYPADLDVVYPEKLSRGLVLIKWWLLAIPHYIVVAFFHGGWGEGNMGLVQILSVFAGVAVLFKCNYPREIFSFIMNMNRWAYRVAIYASLMTDRYPPFKIDE